MDGIEYPIREGDGQSFPSRNGRVMKAAIAIAKGGGTRDAEEWTRGELRFELPN